jgi:translocation and assembly module TamB
LNAEIRGVLRDNTMTINASSTTSQGLQARAEVTLPTEASAKPFHLAINRQRPVRGQFTAQGEIKPLWDLLGSSERSVSGKIDAEGELAGTLADPRLTGRASLEGGRVDDGQTGLSLRDVIVRLALADNAIDVSQVSAGDGQGGTMAGSGRISLARGGLGSFKLDLKGFRVIDNELASATASGQTTVNRGADGKVKMAGALVIDRADVSAQTKTPAGRGVAGRHRAQPPGRNGPGRRGPEGRSRQRHAAGRHPDRASADLRAWPGPGRRAVAERSCRRFDQ